MFKKQKIVFLLVILLMQGCVLSKVNVELLNKVEPKITSTLNQCMSKTEGLNIEKFFNTEKDAALVYKENLQNKRFEGTKLSYRDIRNKCYTKYHKGLNKIKNDKKARILEFERLKKEAELKKRQDALNEKITLAKQNGYKGFVHYRGIEEFIRDAEYGKINITDYKGYVFSNSTEGTYAYKFSQLVKGTEIYQPDYRFGLKLTVGIQRDKEQTNMPLEGQPLKNTGLVSFIGVQTYKTVLGVNKQILMFDRAGKYRVAYATSIIDALQKKLSEKK